MKKNILAMTLAAMMLAACGSKTPAVDASTGADGQAKIMAQAKEALAKQDVKTGVSLLSQLAKIGNPEAQFYMYQAYMTGQGVVKDPKQAIGLLQKSVAAGFTPSITEAGRLFIGQKDYKRAAQLLQAAASKGSPDAQLMLGQMLVRGDGVQKDPKTALQLFQASAQQGFAPAQYHLGMILLNGALGVKKDVKTASQLIQAAAKAGFQPAIQLIQKSQGGK